MFAPDMAPYMALVWPSPDAQVGLLAQRPSLRLRAGTHAHSWSASRQPPSKSDLERVSCSQRQQLRPASFFCRRAGAEAASLQQVRSGLAKNRGQRGTSVREHGLKRTDKLLLYYYKCVTLKQFLAAATFFRHSSQVCPPIIFLLSNVSGGCFYSSSLHRGRWIHAYSVFLLDSPSYSYILQNKKRKLYVEKLKTLADFNSVYKVHNENWGNPKKHTVHRSEEQQQKREGILLLLLLLLLLLYPVCPPYTRQSLTVEL